MSGPRRYTRYTKPKIPRLSSPWSTATVRLDAAYHHKTFTRKLKEGGSFKSRISTGEKWPKDVYARLYTLKVVAVGDKTVTFSSESWDMEPHTRARYNFLEHGTAEVEIVDDINIIIRTAIMGSDPAFFERYTPIPNIDAFRRLQEVGPEFSDESKGI